MVFKLRFKCIQITKGNNGINLAFEPSDKTYTCVGFGPIARSKNQFARL